MALNQASLMNLRFIGLFSFICEGKAFFTPRRKGDEEGDNENDGSAG
jgi:hypothetical protein